MMRKSVAGKKCKRWMAILLVSSMIFSNMGMTAFAGEMEKATEISEVISEDPVETENATSELESTDNLEEEPVKEPIESGASKEGMAQQEVTAEAQNSASQEGIRQFTVDAISCGQPYKHIYALNETTIDYTGTYVWISYSDGSQEYAEDGATQTESGRASLEYDDSQIIWGQQGVYPVTIKCEEQTAEFNIVIMDTPPEQLELDGENTVSFVNGVGGAIIQNDVAGKYIISIKAGMNYNIYDENNNSVGINSSIIKDDRQYNTIYLDDSTRYFCAFWSTEQGDIPPMNVTWNKPKTIQNISVIKKPDKMDYMVSQEKWYMSNFDYTGMELEVTFVDGTKEILKDGDTLTNGVGTLYESENMDYSKPCSFSQYAFYESETGQEVSVEVSGFRLLSFDDYVQSLNQTLQLGENDMGPMKHETRQYKFTVNEDGHYRIRFQDTETGAQIGWFRVYSDVVTSNWNEYQQLKKDKTYLVEVANYDETINAQVMIEKRVGVESLEVAEEPEETEFLIGTYPYYWGMKIKVIYEDGTIDVVDLQETSSTSKGDQINISYEGNQYISGTYYWEITCAGKTIKKEYTMISYADYIKPLNSIKIDGEQQLTVKSGPIQKYTFTVKEDGYYRIHAKGVEGDFRAYDTLVMSEDGEVCSGWDGYMAADLQAGKTYVFAVSLSGDDESGQINLLIQKSTKATEVEIVKEPIKTVYQIGDYDISMAGMQVKVTYEDHTSEIVELDETSETSKGGQISTWGNNIEWEVPGIYQWTVACDGVETFLEFRIATKEDYLNYLPVLTLGETELPQAQYVVLEYVFTPEESGSYLFQPHDTDYTVSIYNESGDILSEGMWDEISYAWMEAGQRFRVRLGVHNATAAAGVTVTKAQEIKEIELLEKPERTHYRVGEQHDIWSQMKVQVRYDNERTETVSGNYSGITLEDGRNIGTSNIDWYTPGTYKFTCGVGDVTTSFDVSVLSGEEWLDRLDAIVYGQEKTITMKPWQTDMELKFTAPEDGAYRFTCDFTRFENISFCCYEDGTVLESSSYIDNAQCSLVVELKAGHTYRLRFENYNKRENTIKINATKIQKVSSLEVITQPSKNKFALEIDAPYYNYTWLGETQLKVTYTDGSSEEVNYGGITQEGWKITVDIPIVSDEGMYEATVGCGGCTVAVPFSIISKAEYFSEAETLDLSVDRLIPMSRYKDGIYKIVLPEDGYYSIGIESTLDTDFFYSQMNVYDSGFNRVPSKFTEKKVELSNRMKAGTIYFRIVGTENSTGNYKVSLNREKELKELKMPNLETKWWRTMVVGGTFAHSLGDIGANRWPLLTAVYSDGTEEEKTGTITENLVLSGISEGEYPITYGYKDKSVGTTVKIVKPKDYPNATNIETDISYEVTGDVDEVKIYRFTPKKTGKYYFNYFEYSYNSSENMRILSEDGVILKRFSEQTQNKWAELDGNTTYYVAVCMAASSGYLSIMENEIEIENEYTMYGDRVATYSGAEQRPQIKVKCEGVELVENRDYTLRYENNINAGIACAVIDGKGGYKFSGLRSGFCITPKSIESVSVEAIPDQKYTGNKIRPQVIVKDGNKILRKDVDYQVIYYDNVEVGTAWIHIVGNQNYTESIQLQFKIVEGVTVKYELDGGTNNPENPLALGEENVVLKQPTKAGYTFEGWYTDAKYTNKITELSVESTSNYILYAKWEKIMVTSTSITSLVSSGTTGLALEFNKASGATGYEISYCKTATFISGVATKEVTDTKVTLDKLESGQTYYVRVRAYAVDSTGAKIYSFYSAVKNCKTATAPGTVKNLIASSVGGNKVKLTWGAVQNAEGYLIYAQKNGKYGFCGMTTKGTTYTDMKALDTDYNYYWVFAYIKDGAGNMIPGGCERYKYAKGICLAVTNLKAGAVNGGVRLTWNKSTGAKGYLIYGKTATGAYGYRGMTTTGTTFTDTKASKTEYNFYWVFPYDQDASGKMLVGGTPKYVYGKAR